MTVMAPKIIPHRYSSSKWRVDNAVVRLGEHDVPYAEVGICIRFVVGHYLRGLCAIVQQHEPVEDVVGVVVGKIQPAVRARVASLGNRHDLSDGTYADAKAVFGQLVAQMCERGMLADIEPKDPFRSIEALMTA